MVASSAEPLEVDDRILPDRFDSPLLVGREAEFRRLLDAARQPPALAIVEGEAGVGKTRLVREFLSHPSVASLPSIVGHCVPLHEPFPLGPLVEALRRTGTVLAHLPLTPITGALRELLPELADNLPKAPPPLEDPAAERHRLFRAVRELLAAVSPSVVVLEDLHWADQGTAEFLRYLVADQPEGLVCVLTWRPEDLPGSSPLLGLSARLGPGVHGERIHLAPLEASGVRDLVRAILGVADVSEQFLSFLFEHTAGIPFAVEEMLRLLQERRDLVRRDGGWSRRALEHLEVPSPVRHFVLERMGHMPSAAQRILEAASVFKGATSGEMLARVAGLSGPRTTHAITGAVESALLREAGEDRYELRHSLAEQAVYEAIAAPRRRELHRRAAELLDRGPRRPVTQLAHHYREAGLIRKWVRFAEAAADAARAAGEDAAAAEQLEAALDVPGLPAATRARIAVKLGHAALDGLAHQKAIPVLSRLIDREPLSAGVRGELRLGLGLLLDQAGEVAACCRELALSVKELGRRPALRARAMAALAVPTSIEGHLTEHLAWLDRAVGLARGLPDPAIRMAVMVSRAAVLLIVGDPAGWQAVSDIPQRRRSLEDKRQWVRACQNVGIGASLLGYPERALSYFDEGLRLSEELNYERWPTAIAAVRTRVEWTLGHWEGLESKAQDLAGSAAEVPGGALEARLVCGLLAAARGDVEEARTHLDQVVEEAQGTGAIPEWAAAAGALARLNLAADDAPAAKEVVDSVLQVIQAKGIWVWATDAAPTSVEALIRCDRRKSAEQLVDRFDLGLRGRDAPAAQASLLECRALLRQGAGREEDAARLFVRAKNAWDALPRPYASALALERAGRAFLAAGENRGGPMVLEAFGRLGELGAHWDAARARGTLRRHGVPLPHRRGRTGYGDRLSPREQEVVDLVVAGETNPEIAEELFLSRRTVEHHVASAMRKLGVSSRTALAVASVSGSLPEAKEGSTAD